MIAQFIHNAISRNPQSNLPNHSEARFFHDRGFANTATSPRLGGQDPQNAARKPTFIVQFKLGVQEGAWSGLRLRIVNGAFLDWSPGLMQPAVGELDVPIPQTTGEVSLAFQAWDAWRLEFGRRQGASVDWANVPVVFDYFGELRTSDPAIAYGSAADWQGLPVFKEALELTRFVVSPKYGYEVIGEDLRGSVGQPYGRTIRHLKTLAVEFTRVKADLIDEYFGIVSVTQPHYIVPYPESVGIPPIWATLSKPPEFRKRSENGWYWNCALSWKEAY